MLVGFAAGGAAGLAVGCALILGCGWIVYFYAQRAVLSALCARQVGEVERPELYALARALRKIDGGTAGRPLPARGALAASSHLMIAHPLPAAGYGRLFLTHPPVGERVRRLEALAGYRH